MPKARITIVGTGFIGGSIGLALKQAHVDAEIIGHDRDHGIAQRAQKRGAVDATKWNLIDACEGAAMIILAMPLAGIRQTLDAIQSHVAPGVLITDTASTKTPVMQWTENLPAHASFVGGNPVLKPTRARGQGIEAAAADAFQGATYCLVASARVAENALDAMANFAATLGAKPHFIDAAEHDGILVGVQHFPALVATALAAGVIQSQSWRESSRLASADWRDATQLAPADAQAASAQLLAHRADLVPWIDAFTARLGDWRELLARNDAAAIETMVEQIAHERAKWLAGKLDESAPSADYRAMQFSPQHFFLGGLAERGKKTG